MSTEEPTTPKGNTVSLRPAEHWSDLQVRSGAEPGTEEELTTPQVELDGEKEQGQKGSRSRRARLLVPLALVVFATALAGIVVLALRGGGDTPQRASSAPEAVHPKGRESEERRSDRTRWVREPGESAPQAHRRAAPVSPRARHNPRSPHERRQPAPAPSDAPSQPSAPEASLPESAPVPSAPAPAAPSEPREEPPIRDGATESTEFGL